MTQCDHLKDIDQAAMAIAHVVYKLLRNEKVTEAQFVVTAREEIYHRGEPVIEERIVKVTHPSGEMADITLSYRRLDITG